MATIHFETLGCKLNQIESESAARCFEEAGFSLDMNPVSATTHEDESVILCVVNTCTVTTKAEQKARRIIRLLQTVYPNAVTLVTGCYAEVEPVEISKLSPDIIVLPGTAKDTLSGIPQKMASAGCSDKASVKKVLSEYISFSPLKNSSFTLATDTFYHHSRSSIKIQDGCNNSCSYCRIHIARGKAVSLNPETVLQRVSLLESKGQKEVVLTGVNLTQYRSVLQGRTMDFADLLQYLIDNTKSIHFRISSLYPERVDDALCTVITSSRVRPHFHLSVQSGSNTVLKNMRRVYNREQVIEACERLRAVKPGCFIACDIITGFPGETDTDWNDTITLAQKCNFSWIHVFPFSPRPGTPAYSMKPQVPARISRQRAAQLTELAISQKTRYIESFVGTPLTGIVEKRHSNEIRAVTENFIHVAVTDNVDTIDPTSLGGKEITLEITEVLTQTDSSDVSSIIEAKGKLV